MFCDQSEYQGFTLFELIIVLTIIVTLMLFTIPFVQDWQQHQRTDAYVQQLTRAIAKARLEAIQRGEKIIFCKSRDLRNCNGEWRDGQIILNESGALLNTFDGLSAGMSLTWKSNFGWNDRLELMPSGFTNGQLGSFYVCNQHGKGTRLIVQTTGRVRQEEVIKDCARSYE